MSEEERAKFEGVKEQLRNRGLAEYRDHAAVSNKIFRRLTWTIGLAESVGIEMVGYVVDQRYQGGTRYFGTVQDIRFNTIVEFSGQGLAFFRGFVSEQMQKKKMRDFLAPFYAARVRDSQRGESVRLDVPPEVQAIMGTSANRHHGAQTESAANVAEGHLQMEIQQTFEQPRQGAKRVRTA
jgi:hypothetical protein